MLSHSLDIIAYICTVYIFLFFGCIAIVFYYAEPGFPWHTYGTLVIGYFVSFGILLLVPIDIATVIVDRKSRENYWDGNGFSAPQYEENVRTLSSIYSIFFGVILIFGSFILVFEEYYNTDGRSCLMDWSTI